MPGNKEIEVKLTLKDEATQRIKTFSGEMRTLNKNVKDQLQPLLLLRNTWFKTGLAIGVVAGGFRAVFDSADRLNDEFQKLDEQSIRLGTSTEQLSKKIHGFNMATTEARVGVSTLRGAGDTLGEAWNWVKTKVVEGIGANAIFNKAIFEGKSWEDAKAELDKQRKDLQKKEAYKKGLVGDVEDKYRQLAMSTQDYQDYKFSEGLRISATQGVPEEVLERYKVEYIRRLGEDLNNEYNRQLSNRYKAEGRTLDAIKTDQEVALQDYIRKWGPEGGAIEAFKAGQDAIYEKARLTILGIKNQYEIMEDAFRSAISASEDTFQTFVEDGLHGNLQKGTEYFKMFGDEAIKIISQIITRMMMLGAYSAITGEKFGFGDALGIAKSVLGIAGGVAGIGNVGTGGGFFNPETISFGGSNIVMHRGGLVRAHSGLAVDEVPIIAQTGERVLSRIQNKEYEQGINRKGIQITINPTAVVKAYDFEDFYKHKEEFKAIMAESVDLNGVIRKIIRAEIRG